MWKPRNIKSKKSTFPSAGYTFLYRKANFNLKSDIVNITLKIDNKFEFY